MAHHVSPGSDLSEEAKKARREYRREWNRKNRDKVKAAQNRFWERKAAAMMEDKTDENEQDKIQN